MAPVHDLYRIASGATAVPGHAWKVAELELRILNALSAPQAHLDVMQGRCSPAERLAEAPETQQQMDALLKKSVQEQLEGQALLGRRQDLVSW